MEKEAEVIQVIRTKLLRRGKGKDYDPIRIIEQFWSLDGKLLAENDPYKKESEGKSERNPIGFIGTDNCRER